VSTTSDFFKGVAMSILEEELKLELELELKNKNDGGRSDAEQGIREVSRVPALQIPKESDVVVLEEIDSDSDAETVILEKDRSYKQSEEGNLSDAETVVLENDENDPEVQPPEDVSIKVSSSIRVQDKKLKLETQKLEQNHQVEKRKSGAFRRLWPKRTAKDSSDSEDESEIHKRPKKPKTQEGENKITSEMFLVQHLSIGSMPMVDLVSCFDQVEVDAGFPPPVLLSPQARQVALPGSQLRDAEIALGEDAAPISPVIKLVAASRKRKT
jgi:hypothetical protein